MSTALGFSIHTGWAAAVVVTGPRPQVLARVRIELADDDHDSRFVYHAAAERGHAERRIRDAQQTAQNRAQAALRELLHQHPIATAAVPPPKRALPALEAILQSHPLIHTAEGELYRRAIEEACRSLGLAVVTPAPHALRIGKMGPPWGKDQKDAAALAWGALRSSQSSKTGSSL